MTLGQRNVIPAMVAEGYLDGAEGNLIEGR